jgi:hypothetical protein
VGHIDPLLIKGFNMITTKEIAEQTETSIPLVLRWAASNGVEYIGEGRRKTYIWSDENLKKFQARNTAKGRPKTKKTEKSNLI